MIFDHEKAIKKTARILYIGEGESFGGKKTGKSRMHPIFIFLGLKNEYICEVRYGGASANALQRGLWTNTKNAVPFFDSLINGWIDYSHNHTLVKLFSLALNSTEEGHKKANALLQKDIDALKKL